MNEKLLEELADESVYSHAVFGCFGEIGHYIKESLGPVKFKKFFVDSEKMYYSLFKDWKRFKNFKKGNKKSPEFEARVYGEHKEDSYRLVLSFEDLQGDSRPGSHTDYILVIPEDKKEIINEIKKDYNLLIELFRTKFPEYDRSEGKLKIDTDEVTFLVE